MRCSKGTYIRTLCYDIGEKLGCKGCMEELVRTRVSGFRIEEAVSLKKVEEFVASGKVEAYILAVDQILKEYPAIIVQKESSRLLYNGNPLLLKNLQSGTDLSFIQQKEDMRQNMVRVYDWEGTFLALYQYQAETFYPVRMFL